MTRVDPFERVLNLLTLLHESSSALTRAEIVSRMAIGLTPYPTDEEAQRQMFTSDRRMITVGLGVPVHQLPRPGDVAGRTEYWIDRSDMELADLELDEEERFVLAVALAAVRRDLPDAGEAMLKLGGGEFFEPPLEFNVDVPDVVADMIEAARDSRVISITVSGGQFAFEPWVVMLDNGAWVAVGFDPALGGSRAVRLDRMVSSPVALDQPRGAVRPDLDSAAVRAMLRAAEPTDPMLATVMVDEITAARAALSPRVRRQSQVDLFGAVEMTVAVPDVPRFRSWLLALGDRAELVAPQALRDEIVAWLTAVAEHEPSGAAVPERPAAAHGRRPGPESAEARLHRLLSLVPWLYERGSARIDDIAAHVGVSPRQVMRDLTLASMCGIPPYSADVLYGFYVEPEAGMVHVINPRFMTDPVRLTPRQATAVGVALSALESLPGGRPDVAARLRAKLAAAVGDVPVKVAVDEPPLLDDIRDAAEHRERVRIEYVSPDDNLTEREIDPQRLFVDRGTCYIVADDHLRSGVRVFRADRLLSVAPTGVNFTARAVDPPAGKEWRWMVPSQEVVVRLPPGNEWVLDRYAAAASVRASDGSLTVWLTVVSPRWLAALLLRCGAGAEVLDPTEYADLARQSALSALGRYQ